MNQINEIPAFVKEHRTLLDAYVKLSSTVGARVDYVQGGGGNTSVKLNDQLMAIKASGYKLSDIKPAQGYAVMDYAALQDFYLNHVATDFEDVEKSGSTKAKEATMAIEGLAAVRPSVEAGFHAVLDRFVAHSHSVYANLAACTAASGQVLTEALSDAPYLWGLVAYTDPGSRLAFAIKCERERVKALQGRYPEVILMQNHGLIVTSDDEQICLDIHEDVNLRLAAYFGTSAKDFPEITIAVDEDGHSRSTTEYLRERLATGKYDAEFFEKVLLYPDQQVFLTGTLSFAAERVDGKANIRSDGEVFYHIPATKAQVVEETLVAVIYIVETIAARGLPLSVMGEAARSFIGNWESEKYRQKINEING